jgi:hypothetical protein
VVGVAATGATRGQKSSTYLALLFGDQAEKAPVYSTPRIDEETALRAWEDALLAARDAAKGHYVSAIAIASRPP